MAICGAFTLTAANAILTTATSANVTAAPTGSYLSAYSDTINGTTLAGSAFITDATTTDSDTLTATFVGAVGLLTPTITNIETLDLTTNVTGNVGTNDLSLLGVTGATLIKVAGGNMNFSQAQGETIALASTYAGTVQANVGTAATDDFTVRLDGTSGASVTTNAIDGITLNVAATSTIATLTADSGTASTTTKATITGSGNLTITNALVGVENLEATAFTGALTAILSAVASTVSGGTGVDTITLGAGVSNNVNLNSGNDVIVGIATVTNGDTLNGGAGSDTLTLTAANATTDLDNVTGVETITLAAGATYSFTPTNNSLFDLDTTAGAVTVNASALAVANTFTFTGTNVDAHALVLVGGAGADTLIGGSQADTLTGGEAADSITGGLGVDSISLSETTAASDDVVLGVGASNYDNISNFSAGGAATNDDLFAADATYAWFGDGLANNDGVVALISAASLKAAKTADDDFTVATISTNVAAGTFASFAAGTMTEGAMEH